MKTQSMDRNLPTRVDQSSFHKGLMYIVLLTVLTHAAALLMNQPAGYWQNPNYAKDYPFSFLLQVGPILYVAIILVYVVLLWLVFSRMKRATLVAVGTSLLLIHLVGLSHVTKCGFYPLYEVPGVVGCYAFSYIPLVVECTLLILVFLVGYLPEKLITRSKSVFSVLAVVWILLMGYGTYRAAFPAESPWHSLAPAHSPGPRTMAAVAYDSSRNRAVLFGGITGWNGKEWVYDTSTWEWDGNDWKEIKTAITPSGRTQHAMAYDEKLGKVILYGGQNESGNLADLWEWDGTSWHRLCPVCNPAGRFSHKMIYDTKREQIVIYGGQDGKVGLAEGWSWDGKGWTYLQFSESSPATYNAPLVYDTSSQRAISFMGRNWGGTWIWQGDKWDQPTLHQQPPGRDEAMLVYDPGRDVSILFGGTNENRYLYNDTWILNQDTWTQVDTPSIPPQRIKAVAFYDPIRKSMILYGGEMFGSIHGDMWELTLPQGEQQ